MEHTMDSHTLRKNIVAYLSQDPILIGNDMKLSDILKIESIQFPDYIQEMNLDSTWGGAIELRAFCNLYRCRVIVLSSVNNRPITFEPSSFHENIDNTYYLLWNGNHYEPVFPHTDPSPSLTPPPCIE
jgi:hypothetical protein